MKKSQLYTRTGDNGTTSLVGGQRIEKDNPRLEAYGTIDELNSWIGLVGATTSSTLPGAEDAAALFTFIAGKLFDIGSYLATDPDGEFAHATANSIAPADIARLEDAIDAIDASPPPIRTFVLPAGTVAACNAHIARTVARRAERCIIALAGIAPVDPLVIGFVNRLSDLLFAIARFNNINNNVAEIFWVKDC